jgi:hypothetical protein
MGGRRQDQDAVVGACLCDVLAVQRLGRAARSSASRRRWLAASISPTCSHGALHVLLLARAHDLDGRAPPRPGFGCRG